MFDPCCLDRGLFIGGFVVTWKIEGRPNKVMVNDELELSLSVDHQRFGDVFRIRKNKNTYIEFFAYSSVPDDIDERNISPSDPMVMLTWNVVSDSGGEEKSIRRSIISDLLNSYQAFWGEGLGVAGNKSPVLVDVKFDCHVPY